MSIPHYQDQFEKLCGFTIRGHSSNPQSVQIRKRMDSFMDDRSGLQNEHRMYWRGIRRVGDRVPSCRDGPDWKDREVGRSSLLRRSLENPILPTPRHSGAGMMMHPHPGGNSTRKNDPRLHEYPAPSVQRQTDNIVWRVTPSSFARA